MNNPKKIPSFLQVPNFGEAEFDSRTMNERFKELSGTHDVLCRTFIQHNAVFGDHSDAESSSSPMPMLKFNSSILTPVQSTELPGARKICDVQKGLGVLVMGPAAKPCKLLVSSGADCRWEEISHNDNRTDHNDNRIDPESAHGKLPRLKHLSSTCEHRAKLKEFQKPLVDIWNGTFLGTYMLERDWLTLRVCIEPESQGSSNSPSPSAPLSLPASLMGNGPTLFLTVGIVQTPTGDLNCACFEHFENCESRFKLTQDHQDALTSRILHHLLRQHGHLLSCELLFVIKEKMLHEYKQRKRTFEDALDVLMVVCDVTMNVHYHDAEYELKLHSLKAAIAELLQAMKRFEEAAHIYLELVQFHEAINGGMRDANVGCSNAGVINFGMRDVSISYGNASLAFMLAGKLELAEQHSIKLLEVSSLRDGENWDMDALMPVFVHLAETHSLLNTKLRRSQNADEAATTATVMFWALVHCAGLNAPSTSPSGPLEALVNMNGPMLKAAIKPFFREPDRAKSAIMYAVQTGCVQGFREAILKVIDKSQFHPSFLSWVWLGTEGTLDTKESARAARRFVKDGANSFKRSCSNPKCKVWDTDERNFMQCPCRCTACCSKACQAADFKQHKLSCSAYLTKKKDKNELKKKEQSKV